ncbi:MAG: DUF3307 domain-containing protein [Caldilineaceae bacterium]
MITTFEAALLAHLCADWLLQNDWMAQHKQQWRHPAAWVHAGIHALLLGLVLGWQGGLVLGLLHLWIDTRAPLQWWARRFGKTLTGPLGFHIAIWTDQTLHIIAITLWIAWR